MVSSGIISPALVLIAFIGAGITGVGVGVGAGVWMVGGVELLDEKDEDDEDEEVAVVVVVLVLMVVVAEVVKGRASWSDFLSSASMSSNPSSVPVVSFARGVLPFFLTICARKARAESGSESDAGREEYMWCRAVYVGSCEAEV